MKHLTLKQFFILRHIMFVLALIGFFASTYLLITYVTGKPIVCGTVAGCEIVRGSKQAHTFFNLPTPFLGVIFYSLVIGFLISIAYSKKYVYRKLQALHLLTFIGFCESIYLVYVQGFIIHAFCTWCIVSALTSTSLACIAAYHFHVLFGMPAFGKKRSDNDMQAENSPVQDLKWIFHTLLLFVLMGGLVLWVLLTQGADGTLQSLTKK